MIHRTAVAAASVGLLALAACGDDDEAPSTTAAAPTTATTSTTVAATSTTAADTTVAPASSTTTVAPATTSSTAAPPTTDTGEVRISVTVGVDSSPSRVEHVPLGATVVLEMTDPNADQEFHIHDYDLGGDTEVPAGTTARVTFVADRPGSFEVESHVTDDVLVTLEVA